MAAESPAPAQLRRQSSSSARMFAVLRWELVRLVTNRFGWAMAGGVFVFFGALLWFKHFWNVRLVDGGPSVAIIGSSNVGLLHELVYVLLLIFGMFLPFVAADGVARDYRQRTHELLMTTNIPSPAFVGGRYLAVLLVSLGMALELLVVTWVVNAGLALSDVAYPAPQATALLGMWAVTILPATVLLGGLSFFLGALWPRHATAAKLAVLVAWVALAALGDGRLPVWFPYWNPTSYNLPAASEAALLQQYRVQASASPGDTTALALALQARLPDIRPWLLPHIGVTVIGLALAVGAAVTFRRFRAVL